MAYTTRQFVEGLMAKFAIGSSTAPTAEQVDRIIEEISAELDVRLARAGVGTLPVTTPAYFVTWLESVCNYGVAAAVLKSMFPAAVGAAETPAYAFWESRYRAALKSLDEEDVIPDSLITTGAGAGLARPSTYLTRNPDVEQNLGQIAEPWFKRSTVF